jgi:DNA-directed RNA polymerase subunit RPC12/RpoP
MQIRCPYCRRLCTTFPEALMGRTYLCAHCHRIAYLEFLSHATVRCQPLGAPDASNPKLKPEGDNHV